MKTRAFISTAAPEQMRRSNTAGAMVATPESSWRFFVKPSGTVAEKDALGAALAAMASVKNVRVDRTKKID